MTRILEELINLTVKEKGVSSSSKKLPCIFPPTTPCKDTISRGFCQTCAKAKVTKCISIINKYLLYLCFVQFLQDKTTEIEEVGL